MRLRASISVLLAIVAVSLTAATLRILTLDQMIDQSTEIVHAKVLSTGALSRSSLIWTTYRIQVIDRWKGTAQSVEDVVVPGGTLQGVRQSFPGAPAMEIGRDYMLFLWTGRNGLTQVIGLSQGLMNLTQDPASGDWIVSRAATSEVLLDAKGNIVQDQPVTMRLRDMGSHIQQQLAARGGR